LEPKSPPVFRFAPSPNGALHLGHALSALTGYAIARAMGGRFLLRIEDIDGTRTREDHVAAIYEDLAWLGITWETPVMRQSGRLDAYRDAASRLREAGLLYPCFANRSHINATVANAPNLRDPDGAPMFPASLRRISQADADQRITRGEPYALRLDMPRAIGRAGELLTGQPLSFTTINDDGTRETRPARPERWGDAVIVRKDAPASYHLAVVVDDAAQGVTHVTRGQDLLAATDIHRLLQILLGLPEPVYHHHRLILGPDGQKLSKSAGDTGLAVLRAQGATPAAIKAMIGWPSS
jgi:glutamyl-Q tRNA(Asp) synthetase